MKRKGETVEEHRERRRLEEKARRTADPQRIRAIARASYKRNSEAAIARAKRWGSQNRERRKEIALAYYYRTVESRRERRRALQHSRLKADRPARRIRQAHRRALLAGSRGSHTLAEWTEKLLLFGGCCAYCGRNDIALAQDHRVPISRGGSNDIANIVPACQPCNSRKGSQTDREFLDVQ